MTGRNKGNYTFKSKGSGLNYMVNFLNAFENGEVSSLTKRKIAAMPMDPQSVEAAKAKASEAGKRQITKQQKQVSEEIQDAYNEIQAKIEGGTLEGGEFVELASKFEAYVNGLVNKHSRRPGFKDLKQDIVNRILYEDTRGVMGLMQSYNPDLGVPLAAYMFDQLNPKGREGRAKEIIDAMLPETFTTRLDTEEGTTDIVDDSVMPDDIDVVDDIKSTGVKIWERTGDAGLEIHNGIVADYLSGKIDAKGKNWKTLQTPQAVYDAVFRMMGIEPKPGNLTKGDIKNAQRWLDKHLSEFVAAVPNHHTVKMVKGRDGKLETRPDKAIGIPKVILEAMFNKGTRVDNLTPWHRKTDILDSEVLGIFGITERGNPNLYKKESNTSARIRSAAKILADAMYNQGVRVAMDINGDPNSDIVAVSEGKGRALFSETDGRDLSVFETYTNEFIIENLRAMDDLAVQHGWGTFEFREGVKNLGIPQDVVNFANAMGRSLVHEGEGQTFKKPLKELVALEGEGALSAEGKVLLGAYLENTSMVKGKMPGAVREQ